MTQVRETQDHGPINTWDRAAYVQPDGSLTPRWNHIASNLIMNGPSPNRDLGNLFPAVDNDDGSQYDTIASNIPRPSHGLPRPSHGPSTAFHGLPRPSHGHSAAFHGLPTDHPRPSTASHGRYYTIADNVVAYGGFKNFLGNDKRWVGNLILYPNGRAVGSGNGPCVMAWGGANEVYENNTCVTRSAGGPGVDPYPWGAEGGGCSDENARTFRGLPRASRRPSAACHAPAARTFHGLSSQVLL